MDAWVKQLIQKSSDPANKTAQNQLTRLWQLIIAATGEQKTRLRESWHGQIDDSVFSGNLLGKVVQGSLQLQDLHLLYDAVSVVVSKLPPEIYAMIGNAVQGFGFAEMQKM